MTMTPKIWKIQTGANQDTNAVETEIVALNNGNFVVIWTEDNQIGAGANAGSDIIARVFNPLGQPLGDEFLVAPSTGGNMKIDAAPMGFSGFVVAYETPNEGGPNVTVTEVETSSAGTIAYKATKLIATDLGTVDLGHPSVAETSDGFYQVSYQVVQASGGVQTLTHDVTAGPNGGVSAADILSTSTFSTAVHGDQETSSATLASGDVVVIHKNVGSVASPDDGLLVRIVDGDTGLATGSVSFVPGTQTNGLSDNDFHVSALTDGGFVVSWTSTDEQTGSSTSNFQMFDEDGTAVGSGGSFPIASAGQNTPKVVGLADGGFLLSVVVPSSGISTIRTQRYDEDGNPVGSIQIVASAADGANVLSDFDVSLATDGRVTLSFTENDPNGFDTAQFVVLDPRGDSINGLNNVGDVLTANYGASLVRGDGFFGDIGAGGDDRLYAYGEGDTLLGQNGDDILFSGEGQDILDGGAGNDTVSYEHWDQGVLAFLSSGVGFLQSDSSYVHDRFIDVENLTGSDFSDSLYGSDEDNILIAKDGDDVLVGYAGDDTLRGGDGHDDLLGDGGDDVLYGDEGDDSLYGAANDDTLFGGSGNDKLHGNVGDDSLVGQSGQDTLVGSSGNDTMHGGHEADTLTYEELDAGVKVDLRSGVADKGDDGVDAIDGFEIVVGSDFNDALRGDKNANMMDGGHGDDLLIGRGGDDQLLGGDGDDILIGGAGSDALVGGEGQDRVSYKDSAAGLTVDIRYESNNTGIAEGDYYGSVEDVEGSDFDDILRGDQENNMLFGRSGDDTLNGRNGDDILQGGEGADHLQGGSGQDEANYQDSTAGLVADLQSSGLNTGIAAGDTYASIENLFGSDFNDILSGDGEKNVINGGDGNDVLSGRGGKDVLKGGAGADVLNGGSGFDTADYSDSASGVRVDLKTPSNNTGDAEGDLFNSIENLTGSAHADRLRGDDADNVLKGGGHEDTLSGRDGDDRLFGQGGADDLKGGAGADTLNGGAGDDILDGGDDDQSDRFIFTDNSGHDRVLNFDKGEDLLDLTSISAISDFADLQNNHLTQDGDDAVITLGGDSITLENVDMNTLSADDFLF